MTASIASPGHYDIPHADYHADPCVEPSLSSSLARILVAQTPRAAWLAHPRLSPDFAPDSDPKFDLGDAVHDCLSSGGKRMHMVTGFADWKKKEAQEQRAIARSRGWVPLLEHQFAQVLRIVERTHERLDDAKIDLGLQERTIVARDGAAWLRAMVDSFTPRWISDFKITKINLANDRALARHMVDTGYDLRAAFYLRVAELALPELAGRLGFRWIFVEEEPPHGVRIIEADGAWRELGWRKASHAIGLWTRCMAENRWPHLEGLPRTLDYPAFHENDWLERETREGFVQGPMAILKAQNYESLIDD